MRNDTLRKQCLTASEFPALLGIDPYRRTPFSLYLEKLELVDPQPDHPVLRWGRLIEPACLQAYADDCQVTLIEADTRQHAQYRWLAATPDALVGEDRGVEIKTVGPHRMKDWQAGIPDYVLVQVAINMAVFDRPYWDIGRLFLSTRDWQILPVERDRELEELLIEAGETFCREHWIPQIPPALDGSDRTAHYLAKKYARHTEELIEADDRLKEQILLYQADRQQRDHYQEAMRVREHQFKDLIGERMGIRHPWGTMTWKQAKASQQTDWEGLARSFHPTEDQIRQFTTEKPGSRRFLAMFEHETFIDKVKE